MSQYGTAARKVRLATNRCQSSESYTFYGAGDQNSGTVDDGASQHRSRARLATKSRTHNLW